MLYLVLILVLAALGLLVAALVTSKSLFAWISIVLSVAAAVALFVDWLNRRRAERRAAAEPPEATEPTEDAPEAEAEPSEETGAAEPAEEPAQAAVEDEQPTVVVAAAETPAEDDGAVPAEEETDAADLLIVCELDEQVIVVDEHPRYHLAECRWLAEKDVIPIAVAEARELGFTPCARCGPDAKLAAQARRKRVAGAG